MFGFLKTWFAAPPPKADFDDPRFGRMPFDADGDCWYVDLPVDATRTLRIGVAGDQVPAPQLLAHARDVAADVPAFLARIDAFVVASALEVDIEDWAAMVRALEVEELNLMWPGRPDDGMVFFRGAADDDRAWRCDYVDRQPRSLGCDT